MSLSLGQSCPGKTALANRGALIHTKHMNEAITLSNQIATEHLELSVENPQDMLDSIQHAGAIFMGRHTCESLGDYCAGPNHVHPPQAPLVFHPHLVFMTFKKNPV